MRFSIHLTLSCFLLNFLVLVLSSLSPLQSLDGGSGGATITFTTLGRSSYAFDIYALPAAGPSGEIRLTDGRSVNFNGHFPSPASLSILPLRPEEPDPKTHIIYVTERNGSSKIYLDVIYDDQDRFLRLRPSQLDRRLF